MTISDQFGEVSFQLCDEFHYKGAVLEIVTPDSRASEFFGKPVICCRLRKGELENEGELRQIVEGKPAPLVYFDHALLATCLRAQSKTEATRPVQHPAEWEALPSAPTDKPEKVTGSGKKSKSRPQEDQPTLW